MKPVSRLIRAATLALCAGVLVVALAGTALGARSTRHTSTRPTIVLVHGAWADGSSWSAVTARLQREGFTVDVAPNMLRGVKADSDYLAAYLASISGPIVLVAHSYGGMLATDAATGNANVRRLVYVDAYIPDAGESVAGLTGAQPGSALAADAKTIFDFVKLPDGGGAVDLIVKPALFPGIFAAGIPATKAAILAAGQRPLSATALTELSTEPAWKTIPSWAVIGTADRVIPPAEQLVMATRAHARIVKIRAPHLSMVSNPNTVAAVITAAALQG